MTNLLVFIGVLIGSWFGVGLFVKWSERRSILDVPNERSLHANPTPVGGGIVIVFFTLAGFLSYELIEFGAVRFWSIYAGGLAISAVSWIDDLKRVPALMRISVHFSAALAAVFQFGPMTKIGYEGLFTAELGAAGWIISVLWIVWMTNAYNFMDGIDGLAGLQAVIGSAGWLALASILGFGDVGFLALLMMASASGFLIYNWSPAKVFMGDVGSAFLGFSFAVIPLMALTETGEPASRSFIPMAALGFVWLFAADTILTFLRRLFAGEKFWAPHRRHHYQKMIKKGYNHVFVTCLYGILSAAICGFVIIELITGIPGIFVPFATFFTAVLLLFSRETAT